MARLSVVGHAGSTPNYNNLVHVCSGGHRVAALAALGVTEFPAVVAIERTAPAAVPGYTPARDVTRRR